MTIHTIKEPSNLKGLHICVFFKVDLLDLKYRHFAFRKGSGIIHRSSNARHFWGCHQHAMDGWIIQVTSLQKFSHACISVNLTLALTQHESSNWKLWGPLTEKAGMTVSWVSKFQVGKKGIHALCNSPPPPKKKTTVSHHHQPFGLHRLCGRPSHFRGIQGRLLRWRIQQKLFHGAWRGITQALQITTMRLG